ncbi:hypothetical protein BJV78DRAFT_904252 [Lactifluus subvellereus]|nr:hypothetical protein BJV78DRAFT_904252 [Lactifluus subvellereus]
MPIYIGSFMSRRWILIGSLKLFRILCHPSPGPLSVYLLQISGSSTALNQPISAVVLSLTPITTLQRMAQIPLSLETSSLPVLPQASSLSSPPLTRRLPRTRSRTHLSSRASLESIIEETPGDGLDTLPTRVTSNPTLDPTHEQVHTRLTRAQGWNGKKGITTGRGMRDVCGICFESAVKPNKARCCGQLFCYQHLSDWLSAVGSDGRCPTCRVPLSLETDTISLHPPAKPKPSTVSFLLTPRPSSRRPATNPWSRRLTPHHPSPGSSSGSSPENDSDAGSSSTSESEDGHSPKRNRAPSIQPKYESVADLMSDLVPLREFGSLLSLVGCALVIGTLLS